MKKILILCLLAQLLPITVFASEGSGTQSGSTSTKESKEDSGSGQGGSGSIVDFCRTHTC